MLKSSLPVTFACFLFFLSACDSSDSSSDSAKGPSVDKIIESAEGLMEEARKAGAEDYAASQFELAAKSLADAKDLVAEGKADKAKTKAKSAERNFKALVTQGDEVKKARTAALAAKKKAEKSIEDMKKRKWDVGAASVVEEIDKLMGQAQEDIDSGDASKLKAAPRRYERIPDLVKRAREETHQNAVAIEKADANKKAAMEAEGKAKEENADKHAPDDLTRAQQVMREADIAYNHSLFQEASDGYARAETAFQEAASRAREAKQLVQGTPAPPEPTPPGPGPKNDAPPPEEPTPTPTPEEVKPGELSAEDEIFLERNIAKFCGGKDMAPVYDAATGELTVEYGFGDQIRKDVSFPRGINEKHILYKDPMMIGQRMPKPGERVVSEGSFVFGANTLGFFLLPFPFKDKVSVEYYIEIGLFNPGAPIGPVLMSNESGKNYIFSNMATVEVWNDAKQVSGRGSPLKKFQGQASKWFIKVKTGMRTVYEVSADDPKKAKVSIYLNIDDEEEPINVQTVPAMTGLVGFSWGPVKFNVRDSLKITGKLDKEAAVRFLKKKLGLGGGPPPGKGAGGKAPAPKGGPKGEKAVQPAAKEDAGDESAAPKGSPAPKGGQKSEKSASKTKKEEDADF